MRKWSCPSGTSNAIWGVDSFVLRGVAGVRTDLSLLSSSLNLARLIGLLGVSGLITKLSSLKKDVLGPAEPHLAPHGRRTATDQALPDGPLKMVGIFPAGF